MSTQEQTAGLRARRPGRGPFWALLAITGLPFLLALYLFLHPELVARFGTLNHGQLVQPPRPLPAGSWQTLDGRGLDAAALKGKWSLLMVAEGRCDRGCQKNLYYMRQIRLAMGERRYRVARLMLLSDGVVSEDLRRKLEPFEGTRVIVGPGDARARLLALLEVDRQPLDGRMFLIDPQGLLILAYPPHPEWKDVLKDLERLLKVVQQ